MKHHDTSSQLIRIFSLFIMFCMMTSKQKKY